MIVISPESRQFNIPGDELVFGVEFDAGSERKYFQCPRYVGDNIDLSGCFVRVNFRNANGEMDSYLVDDVAVDGDNVIFSWVLSYKAVKYKGQVKFVVCAVGPNQKVEWHTTLGTGMILEGLEPDAGTVLSDTADVVAQLIAMVEQQTVAVENIGTEWVRNIQNEGAEQIAAVQTAAQTAQSGAVAEIESKGVNTLESIPDDYTALQSAVDTLERTRGAAIVCEAAGSAVVVNDASNNYIQGLRIFGRSTQDGVPSPDAPVEIVSVENPSVYVWGVNLIDANSFELSLNTSLEISDDGYTITATGGSTSGWCSSIYTLPLDLVMLLRGKRVYTTCDLFTSKQEGVGVRAGFNVKLADGTTVYPASVGIEKQSISETIPETAVSIVFGIYTNNTGANLETDNTVIVKGLRVSLLDGMEWDKYKAIQKTTLPRTLPGIPVTSGGNYTDSDGQQWICDEVDLERGIYVQRVNHLTISPTNSKTFIGSDNFIYYPMANYSVYGTRTYCSHFENIGFNSSGASAKFDGFATVDEFNAFVTDNTVNLVCVLATPIETPLSETEIAAYRALRSNYPNTTVLNDAGAHMVVKYAADTKLYIDNKIAALTAKA